MFQSITLAPTDGDNPNARVVPVGSGPVALSVIVSDPAGRSCPVDGTGGELVATIEPVGAVVAPAGSVPAKNPPVRAAAAADSATATEARTSA